MAAVAVARSATASVAVPEARIGLNNGGVGPGRKAASPGLGSAVRWQQAAKGRAKLGIYGHGRRREADKQTSVVRAAVSAPAGAQQGEAQQFERGSQWGVMKFGGTCMANHERIATAAKLIMEDSSPQKAVVVSAMSKVTDALIDIISAASNRDGNYSALLQALHDRHKDTASALLGPGILLDEFLDKLSADVEDLRSMLKAIYVARNAAQAFQEFVVGHGELWSAHLLSLVLRKAGQSCTWMDAREVLVVSPAPAPPGGESAAKAQNNKKGALRQQVDPNYEMSDNKLDQWFERLSEQLDGKSLPEIIVVTGFVASTADGVPTTLKRDGSDFSASIMGALFRAKHVTIWTDVDGVYSADPRKVSEAVVLSSLTYQEAWEMSYFGANVLHPRTTLPVIKYGIPITIRNFFNPSAPGTLIQDSPMVRADRVNQLVKGFATIDNVTLLNVEGTGMVGVPGIASQIFTACRDVGANVIMISQASSEHSLCFAVPSDDASAAVQAIERSFAAALRSGGIQKVERFGSCCVMAVVGQQMASTPGVSATVFSALAKANINVKAIAQGCSEYNITVVLDQADGVRALNAVHSRFYLSETTISVGLVGPGLIGATLLEQMQSQASFLKDKFNIDLRVLGITNSSSMLLSSSGIDLSEWEAEFEKSSVPADLDKFNEHVKTDYIPNAVIVDCTASDFVASHYVKWIEKGIHVVTPNKKANSGPLNQYKRLRELQRKSYTHYFYEGTVGAGLPIISTLRGLLETGDSILRIEGIFSGTLSYIFNTYDGSVPFSQIVTSARDAGYTEPDPRDDLSGMDVARKVVILARESGLDVELAQVPVQSLVPAPLRTVKNVEEFLQKLPGYDAEMLRKYQEAVDAGKVLRFVGVVDVERSEARVELREYPSSHPFASLSGTDNIISFQTMRYNAQPLVVRGPGAGREVTAGGVFSDVLRLAAYLGAPS
eukprot:jgi/Chlat1/5880/Chrsp4S06384